VGGVQLEQVDVQVEQAIILYFNCYY